MSKAQLCPVCCGKGTISDNDPYSTAGGTEKTCHGCGGCGWVTIAE